MRGYSTNEVKRGEIGKMFLRQRLDVLQAKPELKGKGEVVGCVSGVAGGRARDVVDPLLSEWLLKCVVEWKEVSSRFMWVRVKIERESWGFISAYEPGDARSEEGIEEFNSELKRVCR